MCLPLILAVAEKNLDIYKVLSASPLVDHTLRTPVYDVHILHFSVAVLSTELFERVVRDHPRDFEKAAGSTTLGHNLLHIACLPLDDPYINVFPRRFIDRPTRSAQHRQSGVPSVFVRCPLCPPNGECHTYRVPSRAG